MPWETCAECSIIHYAFIMFYTWTDSSVVIFHPFRLVDYSMDLKMTSISL